MECLTKKPFEYEILVDANEILYKNASVDFLCYRFFLKKNKKTLIFEPKNEITSEEIDGFKKIEMNKIRHFSNNDIHRWFS